MRLVYGSALAIAIASLVPLTPAAQAPAAQDANRTVAGGGITAKGWQGKADGSGQVSEAKLSEEGKDLHVVTGPAITYWNPANKAAGNYTVKATFTESKYMNLNNHPHPYGIMVAGNDLGTDKQSYLYCATYGNGTFILRGFGPAAFQMGGRPPAANPAVKKAAGPGQPVTQEIAVSVKGDSVSCAINGTVVATYPKSEVVAAGKLKTTDGVWGVRFAHNTEATVTGLTIEKQ